MFTDAQIADILEPLRGGIQISAGCVTATADPAAPLCFEVKDGVGDNVLAIPLTMSEARGLRDEWIAAVAAAEQAGA